MLNITWNNNFSVGVQELDKQHKKLIEIENKLIQMENERFDYEIISDILSELTEYSTMHFETEEELFRKYNYPDYLSHKAQHNQFRKRIARFCMDAMDYKSTLPRELLAFLEEWRKNHTNGSDMKYKSFFSDLGIS